MPNDFDRIEDERDLTAGLHYENGGGYDDEAFDDDAYELSDPKHPDHHDVYADYADL